MSKTREERLAANRERQRRWRMEHKWLGEQRRLATYGMSEAHRKEGFTEEGVTVIEVVTPETGKAERIKVDQRTRVGRVLLALWRQANATNNGMVTVPGPAAQADEQRSGVEVEGF